MLLILTAAGVWGLVAIVQLLSGMAPEDWQALPPGPDEPGVFWQPTKVLRICWVGRITAGT